MFGFKKNEKPTLIIEAKDLMEIIKSDYDNDMAFTLIEFSYNEKKYVMGSCVLPANAEECKENISFIFQTSVYKGYKQDKIEMRGDRAEMSDFPLYLNTVAGGLDCRDQTIGGFSFVVKIYALPVVEIIG
jgi:hypothetical protein